MSRGMMGSLDVVRRAGVVCLLLCSLCWPAHAQRVPSFNYRGGEQGPVTFDHGFHASRGVVCRDCHTALGTTGEELFQTQKEGLITLADHSTTQKCFACHDGIAAVDRCGLCHRK